MTVRPRSLQIGVWALAGVLAVMTGIVGAALLQSARSTPRAAPTATAAALYDASPSIARPSGPAPTRPSASPSPPATQPPRVETVWSEPQQVDDSAGCANVTATIDAASRHHVAATCEGSIHYSVNAGGRWTTTEFPHPADRAELGPQLAFDGNRIYLAWTRIALDEGCGGMGPDVGVYYRSRTVPDGAWSEPARLGRRADGLESLRVVGSTLHATVHNTADEYGVFYETLKGATYHRYPIVDAWRTSLRVGSDGRARVAFETGDSIKYGSFKGSALSSSRIPGSSDGDWGPLLVLDGGNRAHVIWSHSPAPGGCAEPGPSPEDGTYYATNASGSWVSGRFTKLVGETSLQVDPASGRVHATVATNSVHYFTKPAEGKWTKTKLKATGPTVSSVIRLDTATGTLLVVYIPHSEEGMTGGIQALIKP